METNKRLSEKNPHLTSLRSKTQKLGLKTINSILVTHSPFNLTWGRSRPCRGWRRQRRGGWWRSPRGYRAGTWRPACRWQRWNAWRSRPWTARSGTRQTETVARYSTWHKEQLKKREIFWRLFASESSPPCLPVFEGSDFMIIYLLPRKRNLGRYKRGQWILFSVVFTRPPYSHHAVFWFLTLISLLLTNTVSRGLACLYPYDWRGFVGAKKKSSVGLLVFNSSMKDTRAIWLDPSPHPLKGTQAWEFFWLRFWILYFFIVS